MNIGWEGVRERGRKREHYNRGDGNGDEIEEGIEEGGGERKKSHNSCRRDLGNKKGSIQLLPTQIIWRIIYCIHSYRKQGGKRKVQRSGLNQEVYK